MHLLENKFNLVPPRYRGTHRLHLLGNGHILVVAEDEKIWALTGPSYSHTNYFRLESILLNGQIPNFTARRIRGTGFWVYDAEGIRCLDFLPVGKPVFCRRISVRKKDKITIRLDIPSFIEICRLAEPENTILLSASAGAPMISMGKEIPVPGYCFLSLSGGKELGICVRDTVESFLPKVVDYILPYQMERYNIPKIEVEFHVDAEPEEDITFLAVCGRNEQDAKNLVEYFAGSPVESFQEDAFADWQNWFAKLEFPDNSPDTTREILEAVSVFIRVQTGKEGGVIAGHMYPMAYIGDQTFVIRALLATGQFDAARHIIEYILHKFEYFGSICNADDLGIDAIRNPFDNEDVFLPAMLLLMISFYVKATGDWALADRCWQMAQYSFQRQLKAIKNGLLPFHGDETERWVLIRGCDAPDVMDASSDSSLLFVSAAHFYAEMAERLGNKNEATKARAIAEKVAHSLEETFWRGDYFVSNYILPESELPGERTGHCNGCMQLGLLKRLGRDFLCQDCLKKQNLKTDIVRRERIITPFALRPAWAGYFAPGDMRAKQTLDFVLSNYRLPSGMLATNERVSSSTGNTLGLALICALAADDPRAKEIFNQLLDCVSTHCMYPEYYEADGLPYKCQVRPYESATNVHAIVEYTSRLKIRR